MNDNKMKSLTNLSSDREVVMAISNDIIFASFL